MTGRQTLVWEHRACRDLREGWLALLATLDYLLGEILQPQALRTWHWVEGILGSAIGKCFPSAKEFLNLTLSCDGTNQRTLIEIESPKSFFCRLPKAAANHSVQCGRLICGMYAWWLHQCCLRCIQFTFRGFVLRFSSILWEMWGNVHNE